MGGHVRQSFVVALLIALILGFFTVAAMLLAMTPSNHGPEPIPRQTFNLTSFDRSTGFRSQPHKIEHLTPDAPCQPIHFAFDGNPYKYRTTHLGRYKVPPGRTWHITNTSVLAERHSGGPYAVAGEWTVQVSTSHDGKGSTIAISSLDNGSGIALQGQGRVDVTLHETDLISFTIWLRPGTWPGHYYYTIGVTGMDCPAA